MTHQHSPIASLAIPAILATLLLIQPPAPLTPPPLPPLTPHAQAERLILQAASRHPPTRTAAEKDLRALGWPAVGALVAAKATTPDPRAIARLDAILQDIVWNIDHLTAKQYLVQSARTTPKNPALAPDDPFIHDAAPEALPALWTIAAARLLTAQQPLYIDTPRAFDPPRLAKSQYIATLKSQNAWDRLEWQLLATGQLSELLLILHDRPADADALLPALQFLQSQQPLPPKSTLLPSLAAALITRPTDPIVDHLTQPTPDEDAQRSPTNLACIAILRAAGRPAEALALATSLHHTHYQELLLAEEQNWPALAAFPVTHDYYNVSRFIPAAALLFSGHPAEADALINAHSTFSAVEPIGLRRQLVLLGRADLINKACLQRDDTDALVQFLLRECRYAAALDYLAKPAPRTGTRAWTGGTITSGAITALGPPEVMDAQRGARLILALIKLNQLDRARTELQRLDALTPDSPLLARAHTLLNIPRPPAPPPATIDRGLPSDTTIAFQFGADAYKLLPWSEMILFDTKDPKRTYDKCALLLRDQLPAEEIARLVDLSLSSANDRAFFSRDNRLLLASLIHFERLDRHDLTAHYLALLSSPPASRKSAAPPDAAALFPLLDDALQLKDSLLPKQLLAVLAANPSADPAILFLDALFKARDHNPGALALRARAETLLGGDIQRRAQLAKTLLTLNEPDLAAAQAELILRIDSPVSQDRFNAHLLLANRAQSQNNFPEALLHLRRAFFANLYDAVAIPEPYDQYYDFAKNLYYCQSRTDLPTNPAAAIESATTLITLDPEDLTLTAPLINAFAAAHQAAPADTLLALNRSLLEKILTDFPTSHLHHYLIAKLDIDTARPTPATATHLRRALELDPQNPAYLALLPSLPQ